MPFSPTPIASSLFSKGSYTFDSQADIVSSHSTAITSRGRPLQIEATCGHVIYDNSVIDIKFGIKYKEKIYTMEHRKGTCLTYFGCFEAADGSSGFKHSTLGMFFDADGVGYIDIFSELLNAFLSQIQSGEWITQTLPHARSSSCSSIVQ
jgi:hypothetical protein